MAATLSREMAQAKGLNPEDADLVAELILVWSKHYTRNKLRERYYNGDVSVKDLGVTVTPQIAKRLNPKIDWAAKCVNWWSDRVQFEGFSVADDAIKQELHELSRLNDLDNLVRKLVLNSLLHSVAFMTVTAGDIAKGEPNVVISAYPATAASALYDQALKRIYAGLVIADAKWNKAHTQLKPTLVYVFTDTAVIILTNIDGTWFAEKTLHGMGRIPMEPVCYHQMLERPFGSSRISKTVMSLVDDAQRELMNMAATAAFSAAPQKYLLGADSEAANKIKDSPFGAFVGSLFTTTSNANGQIPNFGQLPQLSMQPHTDYMKLLASMFSDATNVPLGSLGFSGVNPTSAEAIGAAKEDAIIDINSYILALKRSLSNVAAMMLAASHNTSYRDETIAHEISALFVDPATPSPLSMSSAIVQQISAFPWMADSDVPLRALGYKDDEMTQLQADRRRAASQALIQQSLATQTQGS